jgi:diaminohydroxyphosphoribosylaminopyrimidine deaminase/5-amino-6-(5-phosphoribosylamino)uracil reductase
MGSVRPNPPVGAVVLRDGRILGQDFHHAAGSEHAEILALRQAGERARGAVLVVSLEPCNHHGRTPPCVPAILEAGIRRVLVGTRDPNPASGRGLDALRDAGVEVAIAAEEGRARQLVAGFASLLERRRPRFFLKIAASLDGRIATASGDSKWISSEVARAWVHRRRREADGIMVGSGTALADDPQLTTRSVRGRSPDRIVVDSKLRTPPQSRTWTPNGVRRIAATTALASAQAREALTARGVEVWELPSGSEGRVDLPTLAGKLGAEGYTNVLVEGGGGLAGALLEAHLVDTAWVALSRGLLLGGGGPGWSEGLRVPSVARGLRISRSAIRSLGPDWLVHFVPEFAQWWDAETGHV